MLEVTIPGEDRTEENSVNKRTRSWWMNGQARDGGSGVTTVEVGSRGFTGRSLCRPLERLAAGGLHRKEAMRKMWEAAERARRWMWTKKVWGLINPSVVFWMRGHVGYVEKTPKTPNDPQVTSPVKHQWVRSRWEELFHLCPTPLRCPQSPAGPHSHYLHPTVLQHGVCCNPTKNGRKSTARTLRTAWNQWFAFNRAVHEIRFLQRHHEMQETCEAFLANCTSCPRSAHCARDRARAWPSALGWSTQANRAREVYRIEAGELSTRASQIIWTMWVKRIWAQDTFPCVSALENICLEVCV